MDINWTEFSWQDKGINALFGEVRQMQGKILGQMNALGFSAKEDATQRNTLPLTSKRLFGWHAALFPTGYSGLYKIEVGQYCSDHMQVVSGAMGKEKVHYEAIKPSLVETEMKKFLDWCNNDNSLALVLKAAIVHFWFITIHPFDDGNGRIARATSIYVACPC